MNESQAPVAPGVFSPYAASFFPTVAAARRGAEQAKYGKEPFKVTGYHVEVFDMGTPEGRKDYCTLMERLMPMCQDAKCVVSKNELQVLNRDGGQGWYRYVEWFEYRLNETSLTAKGPDDGDGPETREAEPDSDTDGFM